MAYTNIGLVLHARHALALKTKYMWGGILRPITDAYVDTLVKIYGSAQYNGSRIAMLKALPDSFYGVDCVGLIKSYYWSGKSGGGVGSPCYGAAGYPDVNAVAMFKNARVRGTINTLPETPGLIVFCKSSPHVGVYIGNGEVIESTLGSRGDGVVNTKLSAFKWEYWFECPYISYAQTSGAAQTASKIKFGSLVRVKRGAKAYDGTRVAAFVYEQAYKVDQLKNDRAVLDINGLCTAFKVGDLVLIK